MSHLMRAQLGFYVEVASPSCRQLPQSPQGRLRHQRPRSAGYDCVINATVRYGRVWLPKQHHRLESPRNRGVGTPRVCRPADYLPPGTVGQWPPATGQWWNERRGGDPKTDRATQRGGDPKTDQRKEELSKQLGCEGRGPENPGVVAPLIFCKLSRQLFVLRCTSIPVRRQRPLRCYKFLHLVTSLYIRHRVHRGISFPACCPASLLFRASFGWTVKVAASWRSKMKSTLDSVL